MNRRAVGWLLAVVSPGFEFTTLVLLAVAVEAALGRTPLAAAGPIAFGTWAVATFGAAAGAYLLIRRPDDRPLPIIAAGAGGMAVFIGCVFVAEKLTPWL